MDLSAPIPDDPDFFALLNGSFERFVGRKLTDKDAAWLYHRAPFVVLAHNTDPDPRFIYANKAAQACFEYGWDEFVTLPSRLSAEPALQAGRREAFERVERDGFVSAYSGIRIAKSGRRFRIEDTVIWRLVDSQGIHRGEAATFAKWGDVAG
jgi:hypothetical protein